MHREAVHSKWLSPLLRCVHFRKDFALKWPVSRFHCSKKSNICLKKKFVQRGSPKKKIPAQAVSEKKNSCKLKIPHPTPPPITFLMVRPLNIRGDTSATDHDCRHFIYNQQRGVETFAKRCFLKFCM